MLLWVCGKRHSDARVTLKLPTAGARHITDKLLLNLSHCTDCIRLCSTISCTQSSPCITSACFILLLLPSEISLRIHILGVDLWHQRLLSFALTGLCWTIWPKTSEHDRVIAAYLHWLIGVDPTEWTQTCIMILVLLSNVVQCIGWWVILLHQIPTPIWKILIISRWWIWIYLLMRTLKSGSWHRAKIMILGVFLGYIHFCHNDVWTVVHFLSGSSI